MSTVLFFTVNKNASLITHSSIIDELFAQFFEMLKILLHVQCISIFSALKKLRIIIIRKGIEKKVYIKNYAITLCI